MSVRLKDIGEVKLISRLTRGIKTDASVIKGVGDDCAVIKSGNKYLLFTTDMLVEDVHFCLKGTGFELIGRKAIAVNLSDIAAMGGMPRYGVVSVGLPPDFSYKHAQRIFQGIKDLAAKFKVSLVGGDTNRSKRVVISVALIGETKRPVYRHTARAGDWIFVTGRLGAAAKRKHLLFMPRVKEALYLNRHYKLHSMTDLSDGLAVDLGRILRASRVGAVIYKEQIPLDPKVKFLVEAIHGGEDFELLFTLGERDARRLLKRRTGFKLTAIGRITRDCGKVEISDRKGKIFALRLSSSFEHFKK